MGHSQSGVPSPHQFPVTPAVALECEGGAVEVAAVGHPTLRLVRWRIGDWTLADLPPGQHRIIG